MSEFEPSQQIEETHETTAEPEDTEGRSEVTEDEIAEYYKIDKKIADMDFNRFSEMFQGASELVKHVETTYDPVKNYLLFHPIARSTVDAAIGKGPWPPHYDTPGGDFKKYIEQYVNLEETE